MLFAPLGEVIAAATAGFTAQCLAAPVSEGVPAPPVPPAFGSFVRIGPHPSEEDRLPLPDDFDPFATESVPVSLASPAAFYGVVCHAETGALEAGRPLTAFGLTEERLRAEQPHLFELLATRFSAVLVAYRDAEGRVRTHLPPYPPRPHAGVFAATDEEVRQITDRPHYLRPLLEGGYTVPYPPDELIAALLRNACAIRGGDEAFLVTAGQQLADLLARDYDRLRAIIARVVD